MAPFDIGVVLLGWALLLSTPQLRTKRTLFFLVVVSSLFVIAGFTAGAENAAILRIVLVWTYVWVVFRYRSWLAPLRTADDVIDRRLRYVMRRVTEAHRQWQEAHGRGDAAAVHAGRIATGEACAAAIAEIDALSPSDAHWTDALRLLREYFAAVEATATAESSSGSSGSRSTGEEVARVNRRAIDAWRDALERARA